MTVVCGTDATAVWHNLLDMIVATNPTISVAPRGMTTLELIAVQSIIPMCFPIVDDKRRKLGYKFMAAEAAWILSGDNSVNTIAPFSKKIADFSDDGVRFFGAYGPPLISQLSYVTRVLRNDRHSRQAVATIWRQNPPESKDIPCTVFLQWLIRKDKLHCIAGMRSSDVWLGWPYDVFNFSMISTALLIEIRSHWPHHVGKALELGNLYLTASSQHLYINNLDNVKSIIYDETVYEKNATKFIYPGDFKDIEEFNTYLWEQANNNGMVD